MYSVVDFSLSSLITYSINIINTIYYIYYK